MFINISNPYLDSARSSISSYTGGGGGGGGGGCIADTVYLKGYTFNLVVLFRHKHIDCGN